MSYNIHFCVMLVIDKVYLAATPFFRLTIYPDYTFKQVYTFINYYTLLFDFMKKQFYLNWLKPYCIVIISCKIIKNFNEVNLNKRKRKKLSDSYLNAIFFKCYIKISHQIIF